MINEFGGALRTSNCSLRWHGHKWRRHGKRSSKTQAGRLGRRLESCTALTRSRHPISAYEGHHHRPPQVIGVKRPRVREGSVTSTASLGQLLGKFDRYNDALQGTEGEGGGIDVSGEWEWKGGWKASRPAPVRPASHQPDEGIACEIFRAVKHWQISSSTRHPIMPSSKAWNIS